MEAVVVLAARVGVLVVAGALLGALLGACVNLKYPPGASRDGGGGFVAHLGNGHACGAATDCQSGFCVDGVCCKSACDTCFTCAKPGNAGFCMPADVDSNPRNLCSDQGASSCGETGRCDGAGACQKYAAGTICPGPELRHVQGRPRRALQRRRRLRAW